jgi:hypothetical protein
VVNIEFCAYDHPVLASLCPDPDNTDWLAQCIGNIYGQPHETAYIDEPGEENFPYGYGQNKDRLREVKGAFSDDDTDIEYMYVLAMEEYGPEPTLAQLAEKWKYHVRDRVWLANRAAVAAMHYGYTPPVTGQRGINPHWFQIDPQLINEVWAVTAPGMVAYAADKSGWAARVMDDSWGVEATIWYGAMDAAAFFESDVEKLIDIGVASLPPGGRFATTVSDMKALHRKYPKDWKKARQEMADKYYHREAGDTKTIWNANLNGACGVLGMLYGEGDFQRTLDLNCAMGFDADNQAATIAGLMGVIAGLEGLPENLLYPIPDLGWEKPFNDLYKNITRYDMPDVGLVDLALRTAELGEQIVLKHGGKKVVENGEEFLVVNTRATFIAPLEFPSGPRPVIEAGAVVEEALLVFGGKEPFSWRLVEGQLPAGLRFSEGRISGRAETSGIYAITVAVTDQRGKKLSQKIDLIVRGENLAPVAVDILSNVSEVDTEKRDGLWLTVPATLYAARLENMIRDGKRMGDGQTFYSIDSWLNEDTKSKVDYYGYAWATPRKIGLLAFHTGAMEEMGGWFTSLSVEYKNASGVWQPVAGLVTSPELPAGTERFNRPHFVEYLLAFEPVETTAIRMIGDTGGVGHWTQGSGRTYVSHFSSISELSVHGALPGYASLRK